MELTLTIDLGEEPLCGEIVVPGATPVRFVGWLGLLRCLSDLVESARGDVASSSLDRQLDPGS